MEKQALETQKYASKKLMGHCRKPEEIIKYLETNEKKKKNHKFPKSIQDAAKEDQRGKFIVIQAYLKKQEKLRKTTQLVIHRNQKRKKKQGPRK